MIQILDQILRRFQSDGKSYKVLGYACGPDFLIVQLLMRRGRWMDDQRLRVANVGEGCAY